jgi:hypothetical protein
VLATHSVAQRAATCLYSVDPATLTLSAWETSDGAGDNPVFVRVSAQPADCQWTATSAVSWIRVYVYTPHGSAAAKGTGDGTIDISLNWNYASDARVSDVVVAGLSGVNPDARLMVTQTGRGR